MSEIETLKSFDEAVKFVVQRWLDIGGVKVSNWDFKTQFECSSKGCDFTASVTQKFFGEGLKKGLYKIWIDVLENKYVCQYHAHQARVAKKEDILRGNPEMSDKEAWGSTGVVAVPLIKVFKAFQMAADGDFEQSVKDMLEEDVTCILSVLAGEPKNIPRKEGVFLKLESLEFLAEEFRLELEKVKSELTDEELEELDEEDDLSELGKEFVRLNEIVGLAEKLMEILEKLGEPYRYIQAGAKEALAGILEITERGAFWVGKERRQLFYHPNQAVRYYLEGRRMRKSPQKKSFEKTTGIDLSSFRGGDKPLSASIFEHIKDGYKTKGRRTSRQKRMGGKKNTHQ
ncbi:MAG: hypothetical protein L3J07_03465 [Candidatus Magasanikbacteria bacterium]|nr:hypothetical protein [Candidatus Magasanikbacteria bacterium]